MTVGSRIKQLREKLKLSQVAFGKRFDVSGSTVAQWETDRTKPRHERFRDIAKLGGVSMHWLLEGVEGDDLTLESAPSNEGYASTNGDDGEAVDTFFLMECQRAVTELCRELGVTPNWSITEVVRAVYTDAAAGARTGNEMRANLEAVMRVYRRHPALLGGV